MIGVTVLFMQATLLNLAMNMRVLGSKFTLAFAVFISSGFAFLASLAICRFFAVSLSTFDLLESIPFIVVAIGFEKPFQLTKAEKEPFREKILAAVFEVAPSIILDYLFEIVVLLAGGFTGLDATVGRICALASLIVTLDAVFLFTFYLAVLTLKLELRR
ncbi:3-hydroxy-3-methylglutaryl-coenzyme A (HMG-CoA) reductase isozyme, partial [Kappamyces sp. JEL0680]